MATGSGWGDRLVGTLAAAGGALVAVSLWLWFVPGRLATDAWRPDPRRRRLGYVLRHAWLLVALPVVAVKIWLLLAG